MIQTPRLKKLFLLFLLPVFAALVVCYFAFLSPTAAADGEVPAIGSEPDAESAEVKELALPIDIRAQLDDTADLIYAYVMKQDILASTTVVLGQQGTAARTTDAYAAFADHIRKFENRMKEQLSADQFRSLFSLNVEGENETALRLLDEMNSKDVVVDDFLSFSATPVLPTESWSGGTYTAKAVIDGTGDVCTDFTFRPDDAGNFDFGVWFLSEKALAISWISLYDCTASEFALVDFLDMRGGGSEASHHFSGLDPAHEYAFFISGVTNPDLENKINFILEVDA
jgi:hypothetical protein